MAGIPAVPRVLIKTRDKTMKRNFVLLAILVFIAAKTTNGALVVHEPFEYPPGLLTNQNGGSGWAGSWTNSGATNLIVSPGLRYDDGLYQLTASSNAWQSRGLAASSIRYLPSTLGETGQVLYVSFLGQLNNFFGYAGVFLDETNTARFSIGQSANSATWGCVRIGGFGLGSTNSVTNLTFVVVRFDYTNNNNVIVRFYLNPPLDAEPPTHPTIPPLTTTAFKFNRVRLEAGNGLRTDLLDELRLGTTWDDVTPDAFAPHLLSVANAAVIEGNNGTTNLAFNVRMSRTNDLPVSVNYYTTNGNAVAGSDYTATNGVVTFNPGETNKTIAVAVISETTVEFDETFSLILSNAVNGQIRAGLGTAIGAILDDDYVPPPLIAYEPFAYSSGTPISGLNGGSGWSNAWSGFGATTITSPGLTYVAGSSSLAVSSNASRLADPGFTFHSRDVQDLGRLKSGSVYLSFLGELTAGSPNLSLYDGANQRMTIGRFGTLPNWTAAVLGVVPRVMESTAPVSTKSLIVLRFDYTGTDTTVRFYVNPLMNAEPAIPTGQTNVTGLRFTRIGLNSGGSGATATFDEIRVASTWADSLPLSAPPPPQINVADAAVLESNTGTNLLLNVSLTYGYPSNVVVNFATSNGSAIAGSDYMATNGLLTFAAGETNKTVFVPVIGDAVAETNETFSLILSNAVTGVIQDGVAVGTIVDEDTPPRLVIGPGRVFEGDTGVTQAVFRVRLAQIYSGTVTVDYATINGTATAGADYVATNGTVTFASGETLKEIHVTVIGDTQPELNETFSVVLTNSVNAVLFRSTGPALIGDDDTTVPEITTITLLSNGDSVPGELGRVFKEFIGAPVINVFKEIAFVASTTDTGGANGQTNLYLWLGPTNELIKVAGSGMSGPPDLDGNTNLFTGEFDLPNLSDQGFMSFFASFQTLSPAPGTSSAENGEPVHVAGGADQESDLLIRNPGDGSDVPDQNSWFLVEQTAEGGGTIVPAPSAQPLWGDETLHAHASSSSCIHEFEFHLVVDPVLRNINTERGACTPVPGSGGMRESILSRNVVVRADGTWGRVRVDNLGNAEVIVKSSNGSSATALRSGAVVDMRIIAGFEASPGVAMTDIFVVIQAYTQPGFRSDLFAIPLANGIPGAPFQLLSPETTIGVSDKFSAVEYNGTLFVAHTEPGFTDPNKVCFTSVNTTPPFTPSKVDIARVGNLIATPSGPTAILQIDPTSLKLLPNGRFQFWVKLIGGSSALVIYDPKSGQPARAVAVFPPDEDIIRVPEAAAGNGAQRGSNSDGTIFNSTNRTTGASGLKFVAVPPRTNTFIQFGQASYGPVAEGQIVQLTLTRTGDVSGPSGAAVWLHNGSAKRGPDFRAVPDGDPVFVTFGPGETLKTVAVLIEDDTETEWPEYFHAYLKDFVNALPGTPLNALVNIEVSDGTPLSGLEFEFARLVTNRVVFAYSTTNGVGYMEVTPRLPGPFAALPGAGNPFILGEDSVDDLVHYITDFGSNAFFRLVSSVATGTIRGTARNPDGTPWAGIVSIGDSEQAIGTDGAGNFRIENVPAGEVPLSFWGVHSVTNTTSGQAEHFRIRITVFVTLVAGQEAVIEAEVELPQKEEKPPCNCVPWCGIVGGIFNGVQKVVAGGGKRGDCTDAPVVTVTGPGGINLPINGKPRSFNPAANGTWTVTATICGVTNRCEITLP
jgi:hypothetical protein